ncbi:MAG: hypothetical protein WC899_10735 [bacterium]
MIEVDPDLKRQLHAALTIEGKSLKRWFLDEAEGYLAHVHQIRLDFGSRDKVQDSTMGSVGGSSTGVVTKRGDETIKP